MSSKIYAATFSFLLPGLGQLYQKRTLYAVLHFALFVIAETVGILRPFLPVFCFLSSLDAFLTKSAVEREGEGNWIRWVYASVGFFAFIGWIFSYFPLIHPIGYQMELNARAEEISHLISACQKKSGRSAVSFQECVPKEKQFDPWQHPFLFSLITPEGYELRSAGPDGVMHTDDDFIYRVPESRR